MYIDQTIDLVEDQYVNKNLSLVGQEFLRPSEESIYHDSPTNLNSTEAPSF